MSNIKNRLSAEQLDKLLSVLEARFENNSKRHEGLEWRKIQDKLVASPEN